MCVLNAREIREPIRGIVQQSRWGSRACGSPEEPLSRSAHARPSITSTFPENSPRMELVQAPLE